MHSRRDFFLRGTAMAAAAGVGTSLAPAAFAAGISKVQDLTHVLHEGFPTFGGAQQFFRKELYSYAKDKFNMLELRVNEHTGTHLDAPLHFSENGMSVAEIPASQLVCPLCVIDIKAKAAQDADAQVTPDDIKAWASKHGDIPSGACVAMNSGWDSNVSSDKFRNVGADEKMHFPGFHPEAAIMLLDNTKAAGIAVDTLSLDFGPSPDFAVHYAWLPHNRWGLECVANLDMMPTAGATVVVGAPKNKGGTGGPARVVAMK